MPVRPLTDTGVESTVQLKYEIVSPLEAEALTVPEAGDVVNQPLFPFGVNKREMDGTLSTVTVSCAVLIIAPLVPITVTV